MCEDSTFQCLLCGFIQEKSSDEDGTIDDEDEDDDERRVVAVGICAMSKKSHSRPMQEILERLMLFKRIRTFVFDENVILHVSFSIECF
jgi:inositol hexakisphosphate/diphosphoinositol-pentakisphosphate kinase